MLARVSHHLTSVNYRVGHGTSLHEQKPQRCHDMHQSHLTSFCCLSWICSNNPCLCGGFPSWIPYGYAATSTSASASTAAAPGPPADPSTSTPNMTYTMLDSIFRQCTDLDVQQACAQSSRTFPPEFYQDVDQLLTLAWSADGQPRQRLSTWHPAVPPCTNLINSSSCVMCDDYSPDSICGTMLPNGTRYCNWRHVECRSRRVISINMAGKVSSSGLYHVMRIISAAAFMHDRWLAVIVQVGYHLDVGTWLRVPALSLLRFLLCFVCHPEPESRLVYQSC